MQTVDRMEIGYSYFQRSYFFAVWKNKGLAGSVQNGLASPFYLFCDGIGKCLWVFAARIERSEIGKTSLLAFICKHTKKRFKKLRSFVMHLVSVRTGTKILQRMVVVIFVAAIDLGCGHTVAKHLHYKAQRHFDWDICFFLLGKIAPILEVVPVSSLVMHPCGGVPFFFSFRSIGAASSLKVMRTCKKFCGRIFGQIVKQSLHTDTGAEAMNNNAVSVSGNNEKMLDGMTHIGGSSWLFFFDLI